MADEVGPTLQFDVNGFTATTNGPLSEQFSGEIVMTTDDDTAMGVLLVDGEAIEFDADQFASFSGVIHIHRGVVNGGVITITDVSGAAYIATIEAGVGGVVPASGQAGPFRVDGLTMSGQFFDLADGTDFAGADVSLWDLSGVASGSFLMFKLAGGTDTDVDMDLFASSGFYFSDDEFPADGGPLAVTSGDLDGDGAIDLAVANAVSATVSVLINAGNGFFVGPANFTTGNTPVAIDVGDLDNDKDLDLVTADSGANTISVHLNNGESVFDPPVSFAVGDLPSDVVIADLNNDGLLDVAVSNAGSDNVAVLLNTGGAMFADAVFFPVGVAPSGIVAADLDGDGFLDLATSNFGSDNVAVLLSDGFGSFENAFFVQSGVAPVAIDVGDLDNDKDLDLITVNSGDGTVTVMPNLGDGSFGPPISFPIDLGATAQLSDVILADLDGDDDLDVAVTRASFNDVVVLLNDGEGGFAGFDVFASTGEGPSSITAADLDDDGDVDLATANQLSDNVSVLLNQTPLPVIVPADFNGDGVVDGEDLAMLLTNWGPNIGPVDLTGDGFVNGDDVALLISVWGPVP